MKDLEDFYNPHAFKKQRRTMVMPIGMSRPLEPGESLSGESAMLPGVPKLLRPKRIVVGMTAQPPDMKFFAKGVGGSRRKGRRASNLYFAHLMTHRPDVANLTLDDFRVDSNRQMVGPIPASFFSPDAFQNDVDMDVGRKISATFTNREKYRRVSIRVAIFLLPMD